ncbi:MAG: hypothetical protein JWM44_4319 [Bacilli bacterium]|nr:hypothetical protein [Bacilli bacterium]
MGVIGMKKRIVSLLCIVALIGSNFNLVSADAGNSAGSNETITSAVYGNTDTKTNSYLIGLKKDTDADSFITKKKLKGKNPKKANSINVLSVQLDKADIESLQNDPGVAYLEADSTVRIESIGKISKEDGSVKNMKKDSETVPWGIHAIGADLAIDQKIEGKKVKIAVLDTGAADHPDLKVEGGVSFVDGVSAYTDDNGHGTHVTGTIAALDNKTGVIGAAPQASVYAVKVLDGSGSGSYSQVVEGIDWAIQNGMDIISMSFGGIEPSQALHDAISEAYKQGILIIAAAGNNGAGVETELYPALYPEVISVGAVTSSLKRASYSSEGSQLDLVAPGSDILSTTMDGGYGVLSGTSMAAPHVTGAAAALWSKNKKWTNDDIKNKLFDTATPLGSAHDYGHGLINIAHALGLKSDPIETVPGSSPEPIPTEPQFDVNVKDVRIQTLSNQLEQLKEAAQAQGNILLAKRINQKLVQLKAKNKQLHILPDPLNQFNKADTLSQNSAVNMYFLNKSDDFKSLENEYLEALKEYSGQISIGKTDSNGTAIQSYGKTGDNQTITAGGSATVSLELQGDQNGNNIHTEIDISVFPSNNPSNIVASYIYRYPQLNTPISYTWNTASYTPAGTYTIKYHYPASPNFDDNFTIFVQSPPPPAPDTYEPNNSTSSAAAVSLNAGLTSYISSASDVDYYKFTPSTTGTLSVSMSVPSGVDFDLYALDSSGNLITSSTHGVGASENVTFSVNAFNTYYIKVFGFNGFYSTSSYSLNFGAVSIPAPGTPTGLSTTKTSNSITLYWSPVANASSYTLLLNGSYVGSTGSTSYTYSFLTANTSYSLWVAANNSGGTSSYATTSATTNPAVPGAPIGLSTSSAANSITLSWQAVSGATSYNVSINGGYSGSTTSTSYTFTGLSTGSSYTLGVAGVNAGGSSNYTTTTAYTTVAAPSGLSSSSTSSSITLSWNAVSGATSYSIQRDGTFLTTTNSTSYTFTGLSAGTNYTLGVAANNPAGSSAYTAVVKSTIVPDTFEPNDSTASAFNVSNGNVYSSYIATNADVDYYKFTATSTGNLNVQLGVPSNKDYDIQILDANNNTIITGSNSLGYNESLSFPVTSGAVYYFKVYGYLGAFSTTSYTLTVGIPVNGSPAAPTGLTAVATGTSITLTWNAVNGATSYTLQKNGTTVTSVSGTSYTFTLLNSNTSYTLGVAASNNQGSSLFVNTTKSTTAPQINAISLNTPVNVDLPIGETQTFKFTPTSSGAYKIFTGAYGGTGAVNDTVLGLYTDANLTNKLTENDDLSSSNRFSEIDWNLSAGVTYYVKISYYNNIAAVHASLTVTLNMPAPASNLYLNSAIDQDIPENEQRIYTFTPSVSGSYTFTSSYYGGSFDSGMSDTIISGYRDAGLTDEIDENDDIDTDAYNYFSQLTLALSSGVTYYIKLEGYGGGSVHARLTAARATYNFSPLEDQIPMDVSKGTGENEYFQFTAPASGIYRFFTSPYGDTGPVNDTVLSLYSDANLTNLVTQPNDNANGPFGDQFSLIETNLSAGTTYYIVLSNASSSGSLNTRIKVEDDFDSVKGNATLAKWEQIQTDQLSSKYDVDYYKIDVAEPMQLHLNISSNTVILEDSSGESLGVFLPNNHEEIDLNSAGTYYARVEYWPSSSGINSLSDVSSAATSYSISTKQSQVAYISDTTSASVGAQVHRTNLDPLAPHNYAEVSFYYYDSHDYTDVEIKNEDGVVVYTKTLGYMEGGYIIPGGPPTKIARKYPFTWDGVMNRNTDNIDYSIADDSDNDGIADKFIARNGWFTVTITPRDYPGFNYPTVASILVINESNYLTDIIPAPPTRMDDGVTKVTASNKDHCGVCFNYFVKYAWDATKSHALGSYVLWSQQMYGLNGLEKFWITADKFIYDPNASPLDNLQNLIGLVGMVPVFGVGPDGINTLIYLARGDTVNAALSAVSMVPFVVDGVVGAKIFRKVHNITPCFCFVAGTKVATIDGDKPIEQILVGDQVLSKNVDTGETAYKPVETLYQKEITETYNIHVGNEILSTSDNHPFWVVGKGWVLSKDIVPGDLFEKSDGTPVTVDKVEVKQENTTVYNFSVQDFHTYYVSSLRILTHNAGCINAFEYASKVSSVTKVSKTYPSSYTDSHILSDELQKAGIVKPTDIPGVERWDAHHIVPSGSSNPDAIKAREILKSNNIDIDVNSASNGVFLPNKPGQTTIEIDNQILATHNGNHTYDYYKYVADALEPVKTDKVKIIKVLENLRDELLNGTLELGRSN